MSHEVKLLGGPFDSLQLTISNTPKGEFGLGVDGDGRPQKGNPFGLAIYQVSPEDSLQYRFKHFEPADRQPRALVFADGPAAGDAPSNKPLQLPPNVCVPLLDESTVFKLTGNPTGAAIYELRPTNGQWKYFLHHIDQSPETVARLTEQANEIRAEKAIRSFYADPDYDIYSMKPTGNHLQVPVEVGHRRGHVDEKLAGVIERVWKLGLDTIGSCQDRPKKEKQAGEAYIAFVFPKHGTAFEQLLNYETISCSTAIAPFKVSRVTDGGVQESETLELMNVYFASADIPRIEAALDKQLVNE